MTDLEYIICEAEANGEISIDTRDIMLTVLEHGGAYRRYMKMLEDKQKKADKLSKYATGERKRKYDQESHDLSNEYLTYTNGRRYSQNESRTKDGIEQGRRYFVNNSGERQFAKGDIHVNIADDRALFKRNGIDHNEHVDFIRGKKSFKKDFGGPQKKTEYDVIHSGYKRSKSGPDFKSMTNISKKKEIKKPESKHSSVKFDDELYD